MKTYSYGDFVETSDIEVDMESHESKDYRYSIKIPFKRTGDKTALVVMMNPSKANREQSDSTINNVLTRIYNERRTVKAVVIVNLYPVYETYSSELEHHKQQSEINFQKLSLLVPDVSFALLGWGKPSGFSITRLKSIEYFNHAHRVICMLQDHEIAAYKVGEYRDGLYPKHLGRSPFDTKMSEVDLESLKQKVMGYC
ncbi:DUF1643 domain-containing protein [Vibrio parahaemolyticus]|uniref:DUF1643 domain-containing protein n=1 Tax=Vibrio parahaemolyticus TaxID=670 RepID=UPI00235F011A|nr:DUF1643 domain-containing protein [Vibrio parahaemolyticus]